MAHSALHFFIGLLLGTIGFLAPIVRAAIDGRKLAAPFAQWIIASYGLGAWAIVPNVLRRIGMPESFCAGWWMNIFLLHPLMDRSICGGMLVGQLGIAICFAAQYGLLLLAVWIVKRDYAQLNPTPTSAQ